MPRPKIELVIPGLQSDALPFDLEAIQLAYGTLVVLFRCQLVPNIMNRGTPEVFLQP